MAEQEKHSRVVEFASRHGEKVGFGVAVAALALYVAVAAAWNEPDPACERVRVSSAIVQEELGRAHPDRQPRRELVRYPGPVVNAGSMDPWAGSLLPKIKEEAPPPERAEPPPPAPVLSVAAAEPYAVSLTWKHETASSFFVERRPAGGAWEISERLDAKARAWRDVKVAPKAAYEYRVRATLKDTVVDSNIASAKTPGIFSMTFTGVSVVDGRVSVQIHIRRLDRTRVHETSRRHFEGDVIGAREGLVAVDFNTGWKLSYIKEWRGKRETVSCRTERTPQGEPVKCTPVKGEIPFTAWEIGWEGDDGPLTHMTEKPTPIDNRCSGCRKR